MFRQPLLAESLRAIGEGGRDAYYGGPIGAEIARAIQAAGGVMTAEDIADHRGDWVEPISTRYRDVEVATIPPNSQGITGLMALNVLSTLDWPMGEPLSADRLHAQIEAVKVAWSERDRCVADPDRGLADPAELLSSEHAAWLASRVSPERAQRFVPTNRPGGGTVYLCAADADGMMVSLIESNYMGFGSGIMGGSTGIMLQNRGAYFRLDPSHPNALGHDRGRCTRSCPACCCATARGGRVRRHGWRRPATDDGSACPGAGRRRPGSTGGGRPAPIRGRDGGRRHAARPRDRSSPTASRLPPWLGWRRVATS